MKTPKPESKPKRNLFNKLFNTLLELSGLDALVKFCIGVFVEVTVPPIIYCLEAAIDAIDPPRYQQRHAKEIREIARHFDVKIHPLLLGERERCEYCDTHQLLFVMPANLCWDCWTRQLACGIEVIEWSTGKPVKLTMTVPQHTTTT